MTGQWVTDEQLTEIEAMADRLDRITIPRLGPTATVDQLADQTAIIEGCNALRPLAAEVRASRVREAELQRQARQVASEAIRLVIDEGATGRADVLQQRIDKALAWCEKANPLPHLNGDQFADLRAALTGEPDHA